MKIDSIQILSVNEILKKINKTSTIGIWLSDSGTNKKIMYLTLKLSFKLILSI